MIFSNNTFKNKAKFGPVTTEYPNKIKITFVIIHYMETKLTPTCFFDCIPEAYRQIFSEWDLNLLRLSENILKKFQNCGVCETAQQKQLDEAKGF